MSNDNTKIKPDLDWEQLAKDNYEDPNDFINDIFMLATGMLVAQMDEKNINEISVAQGPFELSCKRAKELRKEYNH